EKFLIVSELFLANIRVQITNRNSGQELEPMRRGINLIAILFSMCAISFAQETAKHPIDKALDACLDKNTSTAGMTNCIGEAYGKWDRELNRLYAELMKRLGADGKSTLKEAQVQWLKFRDAEFKL